MHPTTPSKDQVANLARGYRVYQITEIIGLGVCDFKGELKVDTRIKVQSSNGR
jgi:hypothetical protein